MGAGHRRGVTDELLRLMMNPRVQDQEVDEEQNLIVDLREEMCARR